MSGRLHQSGVPTPSGRFGMVSTLPPTACGLATFGAALSRGLEMRPGVEVDGIRVVEGADDSEFVTTTWNDGRRPAHQWRVDDHRSLAETVDLIDQLDGVFVQHEYGIFGADDGVAVLDLLDNVSVPSVTTLHTVPLTATANQRRILESVVDRSTVSVTMTMSARTRLVENYDVDPSKVFTIPHGATIPADSGIVEPRPFQLLTWGLIGPGKGVEWVIEAVARIVDMYPDVRYVVAGATHPKVLARDGEAYRESLVALAHDLGVGDRVEFDSRYRTLDELNDLILRSELVILPYDSPDQITSGVLVDAVSAGRPVVATDFPHARELSRSGAVRVVPRRNSLGLARSIDHILGSRSTLAFMQQAARRLAPQHSWQSVARSYLRVMRAGQPATSKQLTS
ncbi:MAG: glycosyltransferase [Ilumatobacteraceae bacterium]|jgi:glycosyltransferase involved in cell wall biosynthesis|nr:glycosyltransferase [Ilumatobacteraceae bacterium]